VNPLRRHLLTLILVAPMLLMGCAVTSGTSLPVRSPTSVAPSTTPTMSMKDAAIQAYSAFTVAADKAALLPDDQARALLARYAEGRYLDQHLKGIRELRAQGQEPWGRVVVHVANAKVVKDIATVQDCQDQSQAGLADRVSHKLLAGTLGGRDVALVATLRRGGDGRWRLFNLVQLDTPCAAGSSSS
jgi:hypothetical protein